MTAAPEPFTWAYLEALLDAATGAGYAFVGFEQVRDADRLPATPFVLLRHDIDYDPGLVPPISEREAARGIAATYFFQLDSPYYSIAAPRTDAIVRRVLADGHRLGLHCDATQVRGGDEEVAALANDGARRLEDRFGVSVEAVSFHMPGRRPVGHVPLGRRVNTYEPLFFERITYASDSNRSFRGKDPMHLLSVERPRAVQLLLHPIWWRARAASFHETMQELADRLGIALDDLLVPEQRALHGDGRLRDHGPGDVTGAR